jgi:hypothetical protein
VAPRRDQPEGSDGQRQQDQRCRAQDVPFRRFPSGRGGRDGQRTRLLRQAGGRARKFRYRACYRSREEVAAASDGPDQLLRVVVQGPPDSDHALRQRIVGDRSVRPNRLDQSRLGDQLPVVIDQIGQDLKRLRAERDLLAGAPKDSLLQV